ncbi:nuclease-related domain-containing protein [Arthrobacter sp. zg-Y1110]|uniref:nuclease-related domain-containing protein n=1 Tax=Arthrobacter sp. zg-Y1110 TaxID=2886932 RepID=UPI001D1515AD|nr:nuclease-related domain-containing protein [Arthrobacter sp. zg-Y1110]MCC3292399.1 NERD domain-containing protein [Arthrobacter sp. zg-Y1110]UWX86698.1 NERD domain-containing protein [Arthrobacter sp. zg-Y1110]
MGEKFFHFIKMSWMLYWRATLFTLIFAFAQGWRTPLMWLSLIAAGITVFYFDKALVTFPVIRAVFKKEDVLLDLSNEPVRAPVKEPEQVKPEVPPVPNPIKFPISFYEPNRIPYFAGGVLEKATQDGRMTGFEPKALEGVRIPRTSRHWTGVPAGGLMVAEGMNKARNELGVRGEENFARALMKLGLTGKGFSIAWSVPVPSMDRFEPGKYETDIDCIIGTEDAVFLIDLKNYKSGDVEYFDFDDHISCRDRATKRHVGDAINPSRNMEMATNAVRAHFPKANIVPVVVFMPTDKGEGEIFNVSWPGGIPAINLSVFLEVLATQNRPVHASPNGMASAKLADLVRRYVMPKIDKAMPSEFAYLEEEDRNYARGWHPDGTH